uniref:Uncharacterized protein n=1 Tax=Lepeophtheirus salmonis TaxID=72036 RepID=A0A0K2V7I4_LEPSM
MNRKDHSSIDITYSVAICSTRGSFRGVVYSWRNRKGEIIKIVEIYWYLPHLEFQEEAIRGKIVRRKYLVKSNGMKENSIFISEKMFYLSMLKYCFSLYTKNE